MIRHFVSYPKSGRTWIRYMLMQVGMEHKVLFHHDQFEFNDANKPAHDWNLQARKLRYSGVDRLVYLERDPRDVMVSLYYQITGRFKDYYEYKGDISEFIRDDYFGAVNLRRFRDMWAEINALKGFLTVSYEDCHRNSEGVLRQIVEYFEFDINQEQIATATHNSSFNKMKSVEQSNDFPAPWMRPRNGHPKVRSGKVNGYAEALSGEDINYLNRIFIL